MAITKLSTPPYVFVANTLVAAAEVNSDVSTIYTKVDEVIDAINLAAGSTASLDARLDVELNADGTFANKDTDGTLAANSDGKIPSQKAVKTYADTKIPKTDIDTTITLGTSDTKVPSQKAVKTYADTALALKANLASPALTGTPTAPTAAVGTATDQIATCNLVNSTAFVTALPGQLGNNGKIVTTDGSNASWTAVKTVGGTSILGSGDIATLPTQTSNSGKFLTTNGTAASWGYPGISNVVTATTATTLTSTKTLLSITSASYGVTVTLPDATTCAIANPIHIIDNKGAYPIRVANSAGTLLGFVYGGVVSHISLVDNSTAAGIWTVENSKLVGAAAQLLTTNLLTIESVVALDSNREFILGKGASNYSYGVIYKKSDNTFGSVTTIRAAATTGKHVAIKSATNQILVVSCTSGSTAFEVVTCSISDTTITVNTAATATLSANISAFADGCGLIQIGSYFVTSYLVSGAAQIRSIYVSGTTCYISDATSLDGTAKGLIVAGDSTHVIACSSATSHIYTKPYLVGGTTSPTLTAGTGTDSNFTSGATPEKLTVLGTRWALLFQSGADQVYGGVISFSSTGNGTTTISTVGMTCASGGGDAIVVGSNKVLWVNYTATNNANILTDTAGTASAGTAITLSSETIRACLYISGTDVYVQDGATSYSVKKINCSGASPVVTLNIAQTNLSNVEMPAFGGSNAMFIKNPLGIYGTTFAQTITTTAATVNFAARVYNGSFTKEGQERVDYAGNVPYRGATDNVRWIGDAATVITKVECVP